MKNYIFFFFILSFSISAQNTNKVSKYYIGISYGKSFPLGEFKSCDASSYNTGYAELGNKFDLFGGYHAAKNMGLTALIRVQKFGIDTESIKNTTQNKYPGTIINVYSNDWKFISFLMGGNYKFVITKKTHILPKAMLGLILAKSPEINILQTNSTFTGNSYTESASTAGLAYEFGLGLESKIAKHLALMPTFDFSGGFLTFYDLKTKYGNGSSMNRDYKANIITFNLGLALAYRF